MPNPFPFYRWFPADARGDEDYAALTDQELGFMHRCLDRAWDNDGLPSDLDRLATTMGVSRKYLDKVWPSVQRCGWDLTETVHPRWVNRRQEKERAYARSKSESATRAVRTRYGRSTDGVPRASDSHSDSDSVVVSEKARSEKISEIRPPASEPPVPDLDRRYRALYDRHIIPGFLQDGEYEYAAIVTNAVHPSTVADSIDARHAEWMAFFQANPTEYRPGIGKWLHEGYFTRSPVAAKARDSPKRGETLKPPAPTPEQEADALRWMAENDADPSARKVARERLEHR